MLRACSGAHVMAGRCCRRSPQTTPAAALRLLPPGCLPAPPAAWPPPLPPPLPGPDWQPANPAELASAASPATAGRRSAHAHAVLARSRHTPSTCARKHSMHARRRASACITPGTAHPSELPSSAPPSRAAAPARPPSGLRPAAPLALAGQAHHLAALGGGSSSSSSAGICSIGIDRQAPQLADVCHACARACGHSSHLQARARRPGLPRWQWLPHGCCPLPP